VVNIYPVGDCPQLSRPHNYHHHYSGVICAPVFELSFKDPFPERKQEKELYCTIGMSLNAISLFSFVMFSPLLRSLQLSDKALSPGDGLQ